MNRWRITHWMLALGLASPAAAFGQLGSGQTGGAFGVSLPVGPLASGHQAGFNLSGFAEYHAPSEPMGVRAELLYERFEAVQNSTVGANQAIGATINAVYHIPGRAYHPYLIGGMGAYKVTAESTCPGFNGGAGIEIPLTGMRAYFEARVHKVLTARSSYAAIPISFGLSF